MAQRPSFDDWLDLCLALEKISTLAQMGIPTIEYARLWATCSLHGDFSKVVETGIEITKLTCDAHAPIFHTCPVEALQKADPSEAP